MYSDSQLALLEAVLDRLVPADDTPGAVASGALQHVRHITAGRPDWIEAVKGLIDALPSDFLNLTEVARDEALKRLENELGFQVLVDLAQEATLVNPDSWPAMGFEVKA